MPINFAVMHLLFNLRIPPSKPVFSNPVSIMLGLLLLLLGGMPAWGNLPGGGTGTGPAVTLTDPSGKQSTVTLSKIEPGIWRGTAKADALGLYRVTDGTLSAVAAAGPLNPKEVADMRATGAILAPLAERSGGSVHWLTDGMVDIRRVSRGHRMAGDNWIGLAANHTSRVTSVEQSPLLPAWALLLLLLGTLMLAWRLEGR